MPPLKPFKHDVTSDDSDEESGSDIQEESQIVDSSTDKGQSDEEEYKSASDRSATDDSDYNDERSEVPSEIPATDDEEIEDDLLEPDSEYERTVKRRISKRRSHYETMPSSESEEDESKNTSIPIHVEESSDDEMENEMIEQALSPRTRMSITGIRCEDLSTDEEDSDDKDDIGMTRKKKQAQRILSGSEDESNDEEVTQPKSDNKNESKIVDNDSNDELLRPRTTQYKKEDGETDTSGINESSQAKKDVSETDTSSINESRTEIGLNSSEINKSNTDEDEHDDSLFVPVNHSRNILNESNAISKSEESPTKKVFDTSISSKLSSTMSVEEDKENLSSNFTKSRYTSGEKSVLGEKNSKLSISGKFSPTKSNNSVSIIEETNETIELSSDDDIVVVKPPVAKVPKKPTQQPTIKTAFKKVEQTQKLVSKSFYDSRVRAIEDLETQKQTVDKLMKSKQLLPDNGASLDRRLAQLIKDIEKLNLEICSYTVEDSMNLKNAIQQSFDSTTSSIQNVTGEPQQLSNISWEDVKKTTDDMQPKHFGKKGMETFENQKLLTMNRLETMAKSMENCPKEDDLAETPDGMKIDLMPHQKYGLNWMMWRERQKPRGGILADDMGLGKTLSMIALVLATLEDEENENSDSEDEQPREDDINWLAKGRKDYVDGGTLVVCPASLMRQWEYEINTRIDRDTLRVLVHHGGQRENRPRKLAKYDIVITTYQIVNREKASEAGLFGLKWWRIILDEGHVIRNHKTGVSEACCALNGKNRWILTGTPIQNREKDLFALFKFLRCAPFGDLYYWNTWVHNKGGSAQQRLNAVLKTLMLRRTKVQLQEAGTLESLPAKIFENIDFKLSKDEMNVYTKVLIYSQQLFSQFLTQRADKESNLGTRTNMYDRLHRKMKATMVQEKDKVQQHHILVLLLRLRQICNHAGLIQAMLDDPQGLGMSDSEEDDDAINKIDLINELGKMKIGEADNSHEAEAGEQDYSLSEDLKKKSSKIMLKTNPVFDLDRPSSKINKIIEVLEEKILDTQDKAVIVSQWTGFLDLIAKHLAERDIKFTRMDGKVPVKERNDIVVAFNQVNRGPKIMLLSLCAGGVGLNLIGGNHLFMVDLHWNPQLEAQAQDRVYRVGQKKPVFIYQFLTLETVEERIKKIQECKKEIATNILTGTKSKSGGQLTIDELKQIFQM